MKDWEGVQVPFKEPDDNITTKLASDKSVSSTQHVLHSSSQSHVVKHESGTTEIVFLSGAVVNELAMNI